MLNLKSECLTTVLANVIQMKSEHVVYLKAKSERLIICANEREADEVLTSNPYDGGV